MPSTTDTKISPSKLFGKESGEGKLARIVRSNKKGIAINARKITILKNIEKAKKDPIGDKLPGGGGSLKSILGDVAASMDGIRDTLIAQNQVDANAAEDERKAAEQASRGKQEKDLEGKFQGLKQVANKVLAPIKGIWEQLINFVTTIFLGKIAMKLFAWFSNPDNTKKVEAIGRFLKDFWPALLAGYLLFGNALGGFIVGLGAKLIGWAATMLKTVIPALAKAMARMGGGGVGGFVKSAAVGGIVVGGAMLMDRMTDDEDLGPDDVGNRPVDKKNKGGPVSGSGNTDTVPAMLTPGEFVMSAPAVQKWGVDTLEGMNAAGGGTNKPQEDGGVTYAAGGGLVGGIKSMFGGIKNAVGKMFGGGGGGGEEQSSEGALSGLSGDDYKDLAFIVSAEARRGTEDEYGVAANVLNRVADPRYPNTIKEVGSEPGQYEAVFTGKAYDDPELAIKLASPEGQAGIAAALQRLQGRTDFKGTSQYGNMGKGDILFAPSGNFYHYAEQMGKSDPPPKSIPTHWKKFIGGKSGGGGIGSQSSSSGGGASISAPPPPSVGPPVPKSSVAAYAHLHEKEPGPPPPLNSGVPELPPIDPAAMISQSKIRTLGITI